MSSSAQKHWALIAIFAYMTGAQSALAVAGLSEDPNKGQSGTREYYAANPDEHLLMPVQLWGDVSQTGIYHIPEGTTLRRMIGYVGGPKTVPSNAIIHLSRISSSKDGKKVASANLKNLTVKDLMSDPAWAGHRLAPEDVIYMEGKEEDKGPTFFEVLKDVGIVLSFVATTVSTILLVRQLQQNN